MSKYLIWALLVISCYGYAQYAGYYFPSYFTGNSWKRAGTQTLNHK